MDVDIKKADDVKITVSHATPTIALASRREINIGTSPSEVKIKPKKSKGATFVFFEKIIAGASTIRCSQSEYDSMPIHDRRVWYAVEDENGIVKVLYLGDDLVLDKDDMGGSGSGFYNLDNEHPLDEGNYTLELAIGTVASDATVTDKDKNGIIITFYDGSEWKFYHYKNVYDPSSPTAESDFEDADNWEEFGRGGGGGDTSTRIVLQRITQNLVVEAGSEIKLSFYFDHVDSEGHSTGNGGTATITILRGGTVVKTLTRSVSKGTSTLDVTDYCGLGVNTIRLSVTVDTGEVSQSAALSWTVSEIKLVLTSDLSGFTSLISGDDLQVSYTLESGSSEAKVVACYVDGVQYYTQNQSSAISNGSFFIETGGMTHGQHTVQLRAYQATGQYDEHDNELYIYSNLLYAVIAVRVEGTTAKIATLLIDIKDGSQVMGPSDTLSFSADQYSTIEVKYGAWAPTPPTTVVLREGNNVIQSAENYGTEESFMFRIVETGVHTYTLSAGGVSAITFLVNSVEVELGVTLPNGRTLYLDSVLHGHSNTDINRDTWTNTENSVTTETTFNNFSWSGDGWIDGALRCKGGSTAVVGYKPLQANQSGGMEAGFKYKVSEVLPEYNDEYLVSCIDANGNGFYICANEIGIMQANVKRTSMKMAEDVVYDIEFVVWPETGAGADIAKNARFVYLYIDGIMSGCFRLAAGTTVFQSSPVDITIGDANAMATIDIYKVWGYRRALNDNEALNCFILDLDDDIDNLLDKVDENKIINAQGNITPDSLADGTRIMIISGSAMASSTGTTMASVLAAAKDNQKSKYFPCTEILTYVKGSNDQSKNFIAHNNGSDIVGGQDMSLKLRLQGTSSLAYPVKNYRIYTKKSTMYVGNNPESPFGESGRLVSGGKFAMHSNSAPVAVWCLKADYAESSSSHNTGMACMVHDSLESVHVMTPAQRDVDTVRYPYDVRTSIDGEPCVLFYRESIGDAPIFLGKFNFNNDKSTEAVYGFTDIDGYHDVAPLDDIDNGVTNFVAQQYHTLTGQDLGVDLTECWEFKNNEDPMGSFLDDDFTSTMVDKDGNVVPKWTGTFEARYPDEDDLNDAFGSGDIIPYYLSTVVSWVKSTAVLSGDTQEQAAAKRAKFRSELSMYFDVTHLCSYFVLTQMMACLDQMVKNMMMAFWYDKNAVSNAAMGKVRAYMIFYDNDTILGVINNGRLLAPYDVTRQTIQMYDASSNPVYFYAGHDSALWNNLSSEFPNEIRNAYVSLRGFLSNGMIFTYFDTRQANKFCERIYNYDALAKYVAPSGMSEADVSPYRDLMQGSRKSHRHYFIQKRMSILDNEWRAGEFYSPLNEISYKGISAANSSLGFTLRQEGNVEVQSDVSDPFVTNYHVAANTDTTITKTTASMVGTIFHVYGVRQMTKLNVSEWDFDQLNLGDFPYLTEFAFGVKNSPFTKASFTSELTIGAKMPQLKKFLAQDCVALPSVDLSGCTLIEEIDLEGSNAMSSIVIPTGCPLAKYVVPAAPNYALALVGLPSLTNLVLKDASKIGSFTFEGCPNINFMTVLTSILSSSGSLLDSVNIVIPSGTVTGSIQTLTDLASRWNSVTGNASNMKMFGTYVVNDAEVTISQCEAIGYDPDGAETQVSTIFYGLSVTIDENKILNFNKLAVQVIDTNQPNYNPAAAIILQAAGYGTTLDAPVSQGNQGRWYIKKSDAALVSNYRLFANKVSVQDTNGIVSQDTTATYTFASFNEFEFFTYYTRVGGGTNDLENFAYCNSLRKLVIPSSVVNFNAYAFARYITSGNDLTIYIKGAGEPTTLSIGNNANVFINTGCPNNRYILYPSKDKNECYRTTELWVKKISELGQPLALSQIRSYYEYCAPQITYDGSQITMTVERTSDIYYTTDGSVPTVNSTKYTAPFSWDGVGVVKAMAIDTENLVNDIAYAEDFYASQAQTPTITISNGTVVLASESGATIYYTTDGTFPTKSSSVYSGPITSSEDIVKIRCFAVKEGKMSSEIAAKMCVLNNTLWGTDSDSCSFAVQSMDSTKPNYNPAVCVIFFQNKVMLSDYVFGGGGYMTKTKAATVSNFGNGTTGNPFSFMGVTTVENDYILSGSYDFDSFNEFKYFTSVTVYDGTNNSSPGVFGKCTKLEEITFPSQVTGIKTYMFFGCTALKYVYNLNSITSIARNAFDSCSSLINVYGLTSVTSIAREAFKNCANLELSSLPQTLVSADQGAFYNCQKVAFDTLGASFTTIGWSQENSCFINTYLIPFLHLEYDGVVTKGENYARTHNYSTFRGTTYKIYVGNGNQSHDDALLAQYVANTSNWSNMASYLDTWYNYLHP